MKRTTKSIITIMLALVMIVSLVPASALAKTTTYKAYLCVQTNTSDWIFRNAYDSKDFGYKTKEFKGLYNSKQKKVMDGKFTDVKITKNGTYTVKLDNPDFGSETTCSQLFVSTNIPVSKKVKVTDVKVKINGSTKYTFKTAMINPESKKYVQIMCQNIWNPKVKDLFQIPMPFTKAEITFTIKGLK